VTRVLIADDQALIRGGLRMILEVHDDLEVVAEAEDGAQAVRLARELVPDVVLMDIRMPGTDGLQATRQIITAAGPTVRVLILTTYDHDDYVYEALRGGAAGFLLKTAPPHRLVDAVRVVAAGEALLAPSVTRRLIEEHVRRPPRTGQSAELARLTARELEVMTLVARGLSNAEIAAELVLSESTVKTHVNRLLRKLGLRDRVQAVVRAYEAGLIQPGR
jgi:DNA-binding NarL/FixJ family response regulator